MSLTARSRLKRLVHEPPGMHNLDNMQCNPQHVCEFSANCECCMQGHTSSKKYLIWRTMAASLSCWYIQLKMPSSSMSFQMAPWPPGFRMGAKPCGTSHLPSAALTSGTRGCRNSLQQHSLCEGIAFFSKQAASNNKGQSGSRTPARYQRPSLFRFTFACFGGSTEADQSPYKPACQSPLQNLHLMVPTAPEHCKGFHTELTSNPAWRETSQRRLGYLKDSLPRPNQSHWLMNSVTRLWLSLASEVMMAMGVICCTPCSL